MRRWMDEECAGTPRRTKIDDNKRVVHEDIISHQKEQDLGGGHGCRPHVRDLAMEGGTHYQSHTHLDPRLTGLELTSSGRVCK